MKLTWSCALIFIIALFTTAQLWKQPRCPTTDEWIKKLSCRYTMEYYSPTRNNDMWFEGHLLQLEDIMLNEVRQDLKHKRHIFSHMWKMNPKINIYTKIGMIVYKLRSRTCL
jgi:hypothetical protein